MTSGKLLVDAREAAETLGVSERQFHLLRKDPTFPLPVELGPRTVRWRTSELAEFVGSLAVRRAGPEPAQFRRSRLARTAATQAENSEVTA